MRNFEMTEGEVDSDQDNQSGPDLSVRVAASVNSIEAIPHGNSHLTARITTGKNPKSGSHTMCLQERNLSPYV